MFEMKSDFVRKHKFDSASKDARKMGRIPNQSIVETAEKMRNKPIVKTKRRIPWITILTIATAIPFFMNDKGTVVNLIDQTSEAQKEQMGKALESMQIDNNEPLNLSIEMGDKRIHKKITASDLEAAKSYLSD